MAKRTAQVTGTIRNADGRQQTVTLPWTQDVPPGGEPAAAEKLQLRFQANAPVTVEWQPES